MNEKKKEIDEIIDKAGELARVAQPLSRMKVQSGDIAVELEWSHPATETAAAAATRAVPATPADGQAPSPGPEADAAAGSVCVCSPLVGTFYHAPKPGEPPFVRPGDTVEAGQQVGILEAMKLMNPIEADQRGVVTEILVPDGTPVEYGQPLIALVGPES